MRHKNPTEVAVGKVGKPGKVRSAVVGSGPLAGTLNYRLISLVGPKRRLLCTISRLQGTLKILFVPKGSSTLALHLKTIPTASVSFEVLRTPYRVCTSGSWWDVEAFLSRGSIPGSGQVRVAR